MYWVDVQNRTLREEHGYLLSSGAFRRAGYHPEQTMYVQAWKVETFWAEQPGLALRKAITYLERKITRERTHIEASQARIEEAEITITKIKSVL